MTILEYIDKYGDKNFEEEKFNEIDNVIFASVSYLDFDGIVSKSMHGKITIKDAKYLYLRKLYEEKNKITAHKSALRIFKKISTKKRYRDLKLYNYKYIGNDNEQFCAVSIDIDDKLTYLSFEGTDNLISGWKEDFYLACFYPVPSHKSSINYVNRFIFSNRKLILGGHSKGGNLALVAGMEANHFVKKKIIAVYSNDGPGLRKNEFNSREYKEVLLKLHSIIPNYSLFGLLLRHTNKYKVIESNKKGIYAHDLLSWQVEDKEFKKSELSNFSKLFDKSMLDWVNKYDDETRLLFVNSIFEIFDKTGIKDIEEIFKKKTLILKIIIESKLPKETKKMLRDFLKVVFEYSRQK